MNYIKRMKSLNVIILVLSCLVLSGIGVRIMAAPVNAPRTFPTPQAAADALIAAADNFDVPALEQIFGPDGKDIIHTGEPAHDKEVAKQFADKAHEKMEVSLDTKTKRRAFVSVGDEAWPFPVPIVKTGNGWSFDSKAGLNEILLRRVGRDELDAMQILRGFVEAQDDYAESKHDGAHVNEYAQKIISTPGKQDGLAWQNPDGSWGGPIGENVAKAIARGYSSSAEEPFHGYYFKVLKGQGPDAPLGQMDYVVNGSMIGGFALIAFPAQYKVTGVMTFIVSNDGVVYQRDLGPNTLETASKIERFNPDKTWSPVKE